MNKYLLLGVIIYYLIDYIYMFVFERSLRLAKFFHKTNNSDYDNRHNKFRPKSSWTPISNRDKFLDSYISIITSEIMNAPEHKSYGNLSFEERSVL